MHSPSGHCVTLRAGAYEAEVVEVGAGLRALRRDGLDVVAGYPPDQMAASGRGQLLIPWPNRIEDGRYEFRGSTYQLGLSEPAKRNASHGLTRWVNWGLVEDSEATTTWQYRLPPQPGYPFQLELTAAYALSPGGLRVDLTATNVGDTAAPYGHGAHPYLTVGRRIDDCELTLPATTRSETDDRGLPGPPVSTDGGPFDFRAPRLIGSTSFDHPFSGLQAQDGSATVVLRDPDSGRTASLAADAAYPWLQIFSGDALPSGARESLAVEPMTCPANAFRSGLDLLVLEPGETHSAGFTIS